MSELNKELLYGTGKRERIVAVEVPRGQENQAHLFIRNEDDEIYEKYEHYSFRVLLNENDPVLGELYGAEIIELLGDNFYNRMVVTDQYSTYRYITKNAYDAYEPFLQTQWFLETQDCQFKGMLYEDKRVMYPDLETLTKKGYKFPNPTREEDKIIAIAIKTNRDHNLVLALNDDGETPEGENRKLYNSESELIEAFIKSIQKFDPDVIANHNIFNFDLDYFRARCDLHGIKMALGRDGSVPYHHPSKIKFAGRERQYTNYKIYGRHVIDTQYLAEQYDVFARELPGVGLKDVAKFLTKKYDAGITREGRVYIDGDELADVWRNEHPTYTRGDLLEYAIDDVNEAEGLYKFFYSANFDCAKFMPMPYQDVFRYGSGNKLEYLLLRNYIDYEVSWPKPDEREDYEGGYADVLEYGFINEPQVYVDVSSLYPWSIIEQGVNPPKDILGLFLNLVILTRSLRFETKFKIPDATGKEERILKSADAALKIILNSWYGYLGYEWGSMNYYEGARKTTELGREVMNKMIERAQVLGSRVVKVDTDGMLCTVPPAYKWGDKKGELDFIKVIEQQLDRQYNDLKLDHDGRYEKTMIIDKKSYVLREYDGTLTFKGNTIKGRNLQPFTVKFLKKAIDFIFENDYIGVRNEFDYWKSMIESGLIEAENLKTRKTLGMTLSDYQHKIESGNNPITQYELALKSERKYTMGDAIEYYVSAPPMIEKEYKTVPNKWVPKKMANYEKAKMLDDYDNDPDVNYYIERLEKTVKKLIVVFGEDKFTELFPEISIHKKDRTKLKLLEGETNE